MFLDSSLVRLLGCQVIGLLGDCFFGLLGFWIVGLLGCLVVGNMSFTLLSGDFDVGMLNRPGGMRGAFE